MTDFTDTRLTEKDSQGRVRTLIPKFQEMIFALTDVSVQVSTLEIGDSRPSITDIKRTILNVRREIVDWLKWINLQGEKRRARFESKGQIKVSEIGPFYPGGTFDQDRDLMPIFFKLIQQFNDALPLVEKIEKGNRREHLSTLYKSLDEIRYSLFEWNVRMNEIKIYVLRKTSERYKAAGQLRRNRPYMQAIEGEKSVYVSAAEQDSE